MSEGQGSRRDGAARVGIIGVGHHTYWGQFPGLLDELRAKLTVFAGMVGNHGVAVSTYGIVDTAATAAAAMPAIVADDPDLLFIDMVTYATSSTFGVLARNLKVPIVLVALQPRSRLDYAAATTYMQLCNDDFCSVPEFTGVAIRMGRRPPPVIVGTLHDDPMAAAEVHEWCRISQALHDLRHGRIGLMGHVLESMLDMHADPTAVTAAFGCHVPLCEPEELIRHCRHPDAAAMKAKRAKILSFFDLPDPAADPLTQRLTDEDLDRAVRTAVGLDAFVAERRLSGLTYYYEGEEGSETRATMSSLIVGNSLLTAAGFPMCGEFDIKTCLAMMIMDRLEMGGSFAEFHPIDFERGTVLVGHDGPHHLRIASGRPVLRSLRTYHGKPGRGASVEFSIRSGPITLLSIGLTAAGRFKFVIAEGHAEDGPIPATGNTNTHGRFAPDVRSFLRRWVAEGPTHHFALGVGHRAGALASVADCLGIEWARVTPDLVPDPMAAGAAASDH